MSVPSSANATSAVMRAVPGLYPSGLFRFKREQTGADLRVEMTDRFLQILQMRQLFGEREALMSAHPSR